MLKTLILAAASALALVTLSGCASHATTAAATPVPAASEQAVAAAAERLRLALIDRDVHAFCYPHWDQDDDVRREVLAAGYQIALGGEQPAHEPSLLHRVDLGRLDGISLRYRLRGWRHRLHRQPVVSNTKGAAKRLLKRGR